MLKPTLAHGTTCEFDDCATGKVAVHHYRFRDLCAYHSPFDVIRCEGCAAVIIDGELCVECEVDDQGFREVTPAVSLVKPFPKGARVLYQPTFGKIRTGYVLGQEREGMWHVKLDDREWPVRGGTLQLERI